MKINPKQHGRYFNEFRCIHFDFLVRLCLGHENVSAHFRSEGLVQYQGVDREALCAALEMGPQLQLFEAKMFRGFVEEREEIAFNLSLLEVDNHFKEDLLDKFTRFFKSWCFAEIIRDPSFNPLHFMGWYESLAIEYVLDPQGFRKKLLDSIVPILAQIGLTPELYLERSDNDRIILFFDGRLDDALTGKIRRINMTA